MLNRTSKQFGVLLAILAALSGCGGEDTETSSVAAIVGKDFSGAYRFSWVECYDGNYDLSALATVSASSSVSTLVITGNTTESTTATNSCTVRMAGRIQFNETDVVSGVSVGSVDMLTSSISVVGASSCTVSTTLEPVSGSPAITPSSLSSTWNNSSSGSSNTADYLRDTDGNIYMFSVFQVSGYPSDICFMAYDRL